MAGVEIHTELNAAELRALRQALGNRLLGRVLRKSGTTGLRDARSEASKRIRARKRLKVAAVRKALVQRRPGRGGGIETLEWAIDVRGDPVPLSAYPHRQTRKGVSVTVNRGKRTVVKGAFVALMSSGHKGIFVRRGARRLPIRELLGSRPADALLHAGEADAVLTRGRVSFVKTFERVLQIELDKAKGR